MRKYILCIRHKTKRVLDRILLTLTRLITTHALLLRACLDLLGNILAKAAALLINLNIHSAPIASGSQLTRHTRKPLASYPRVYLQVSPSPAQPSVCEAFRSLSLSF